MVRSATTLVATVATRQAAIAAGGALQRPRLLRGKAAVAADIIWRRKFTHLGLAARKMMHAETCR
jgi:hypothetical protein